jgi:hypothetical protein
VTESSHDFESLLVNFMAGSNKRILMKYCMNYCKVMNVVIYLRYIVLVTVRQCKHFIK